VSICFIYTTVLLIDSTCFSVLPAEGDKGVKVSSLSIEIFGAINEEFAVVRSSATARVTIPKIITAVPKNLFIVA